MTEYDEGSIGTFPKVLLGVLGALGIALVLYLGYAAVRGPESPELPAPPTVQVKADRPKPPPPAALLPEELFAQASPAVVRLVVRDRASRLIGRGSGFFISPDGLLVTNYHVIRGAHSATVLLGDDTALAVEGLTAADTQADLVILKVPGKSLPYLKGAVDPLPKVGAKVYAIGSPRGLKNTYSAGIVSGHRQFKDGLRRIQTDASVGLGSSGGPLLNDQGKVVGVTAGYRTGGQNLNFAVPVASVRRLVRKQGKPWSLAYESLIEAALDRAEAELRRQEGAE